MPASGRWSSSYGCSRGLSVTPRERGHHAHEEARLVVVHVVFDLLVAARIGPGELAEDREVAGGEVRLHGVVDQLGVFPRITPGVTRMECQREVLADRLRVVGLGVLTAIVPVIQLVGVPLL